ncbi:hypothetical protein T4E_3990 [Trichinella pseudospiralis]|uniref:Secreted protein n=1 Tax=Trichinella pseudospiralis TaxID=6337 RepID=A0A0V0Y7E1_TRIPS|nr:hypothetical protein T4E_3990 [Trichinella pseudospiralis]
MSLFSRVRICVQKQLMMILLSVLKRCIGVGVGVAGCMPTTKRSSLCIFSLHIGRQRCRFEEMNIVE